LLRIIGGKQLFQHGEVIVLGAKAYENTPASLSFVSSDWASNPLVKRDVKVLKLIEALNGKLT
jgi:hypothetical protein